MASITSVAETFFAACETGKGWEVCHAYCVPNATSGAQAKPLLDVKTLAQYTRGWRADLSAVARSAEVEAP